ncbi:MAG: hypothetical protein ACJ75J_04370 [Cytophagaceae bacterium]
MLNLFLTTLFTVFLFIFFRITPRFRMNHFHVIVCNYFVCLTLAILSNDIQVIRNLNYSDSWITLSLLTGCLFPLSFYLMALTIEKVSISVAGVANKMSMILPVSFNFMILHIGARDLKALNIIGICLALPAILLASLKPSDDLLADSKKQTSFILPFMVFLIGGFIDTLINYISFQYLSSRSDQLLFPVFTFTAAALTGSIIVGTRIALKHERLEFQSILGGMVLGVPNFLSIYFMLKTLDDFGNDGAVVFPILNIAVIILTSLSGLLFFREKLSGLNITGILLALLSIVLVFLNWELFLSHINALYSNP